MLKKKIGIKRSDILMQYFKKSSQEAIVKGCGCMG
jgi:hypothetical protein